MVKQVIIKIIAAIGILIGLAILALELQYRRRSGNDIELTPGEWQLNLSEPQHYQLVGEMTFFNRTSTLEIMLPEIDAGVKLLSEGSLEGINCKVKVISCHPDASPRPDHYWFGYIVKSRKTTQMRVMIDLTGTSLNQLESAWLKIRYITYGPQGRIPKNRHIILPLKYPDSNMIPQGRSVTVGEVFPIKTHVLSVIDDPVDVVKKYVLPHAKPGDIITIGETPVAIMQGRFRHPSEVKPGWVARRICYFFMPTSSLATACGLQCLVDIVGPWRVLLAFLGGSIAKVLGKPGMFYQLAGEQARLIDDVTGTLPPYDQFIVLGPMNPQKVVDDIERETGLRAAIVDVNDLKAVQILASSGGVSPALLGEALRSNPAGNGDEKTPLVLVRPHS